MWVIVFQGIASCHQPASSFNCKEYFQPAMSCFLPIEFEFKYFLQPSSVVSSEFSPRILIWYPSTSPRACIKGVTSYIFKISSHLVHVLLLGLPLIVELVAMTCHAPLQPVLRDVLPVPIVESSPSVQYQVDPWRCRLVLRVEHQVGEPHVLQKLRHKIVLIGSKRNLHLLRIAVKITVRKGIWTDGVTMPWCDISSRPIHRLIK